MFVDVMYPPECCLLFSVVSGLLMVVVAHAVFLVLVVVPVVYASVRFAMGLYYVRYVH
jgi:hypothetical protein